MGIEPEVVLDLLAGRLSEPAVFALRAQMESQPALRVALLGLLLDLERRDSAQARAAFSEGDTRVALDRILDRIRGEWPEPGGGEHGN